jgi:16S rRNA (guanine527-N7)-methyltransferase
MEKLARALNLLGVNYQEDTLDKYKKYMDLVLSWNKRVNLTSITDKNEFVTKHFIDSIFVCGFSQMHEINKVIDVGTGAGFPGIPLAIVYPDKEFLLIDSTNKRIKIIYEISREIGLKNVTFLHGRAEDIAHNKKHREQFDLCVSRAVAKLAVLSEYCLPFVKVGGWFAAYKSQGIEKELAESQNAYKLLGGHLEKNNSISIDGFGLDHRILMIKKIKQTPAKYPRKAGTPTKDPLK